MSKKVNELENNQKEILGKDEKILKYLTTYLSTQPLGNEDGQIRDNQLSASSFQQCCKPTFSCLNTNGRWSPESKDKSPWLQVDLGMPTVVIGLITEAGGQEWMTSYKVSYRLDTDSFIHFSDVFQGNFDQNTKVTNYFPHAIQARYLRIHPVTWNNQHSTPDLRVEV